MSLVLVRSDQRTLKIILGVILGLASIVGGWIVFSAEGFYSPVLFLTGFLMMPVGVLAIGLSLTSFLARDHMVPIRMSTESPPRD